MLEGKLLRTVDRRTIAKRNKASPRDVVVRLEGAGCQLGERGAAVEDGLDRPEFEAGLAKKRLPQGSTLDALGFTTKRVIGRQQTVQDVVLPGVADELLRVKLGFL